MVGFADGHFEWYIWALRVVQRMGFIEKLRLYIISKTKQKMSINFTEHHVDCNTSVQQCPGWPGEQAKR